MDTITAPLNFVDLLLRLTIASVLGGAIGLNRELQEKPAGLRTHALVSLGAALAMLIGLLLQTAYPADVSASSRVLQGIVAGIGFIGGGVILHRDDSKGVHGLTTAASIWVVAGVGSAAGAGMWRSATAAMLLALLVLTLGEPIDRALRARRQR